MEEFGLPLGLVIIDTIVVSAGYPQPGAENDPAVGQALMNVLKEAAQRSVLLCVGRRSLRQGYYRRHPRHLSEGSVGRRGAGLPGRPRTKWPSDQYPLGGTQMPRRSAGGGILLHRAKG